MGRQRNQIADIAVASGNVIDNLAQFFPVRRGNIAFQPQLCKIAIQIRFNRGNRFVVHLLAASVDELDAVVIERVVRSGNHDAAVKAVHARHIRNARRGRNVKHIRIRAGRGQACNQCVFKHIAGAAGILANDDACLSALARAVIPADEFTDFISMFAGQIHIGFASEAVRTKILSHIRCLSRSDDRYTHKLSGIK